MNTDQLILNDQQSISEFKIRFFKKIFNNKFDIEWVQILMPIADINMLSFWDSEKINLTFLYHNTFV